MNKIDHYLTTALEQNASDLHFISGDPVRARVHGKLRVIMDEKLTTEAVQEAMFEIMDGTTQKNFHEHNAADFAYEIPGKSRFRINAFRHLNGIGAIMRAIPSKALTLDELAMPRVIHDLCKYTSGMILVTGKTGSGKSTTLAAMIDAMNKRLKGHILTIEDPVEFVHQPKGCLISQREIGVHSTSFSEALHSALREDPDVILVGEMRDLETIRLALTAAETGHLVFGTLHTSSAAKTIDRVVDVFPAAEKDMVRSMLSESLRAVISQSLLKKNGGGRVAAHEIMIGTPAIRNLIRENKIAQMYSAIQTGQNVGMHTLDQYLEGLVKRGIVSRLEAARKAVDRKLFM